jgi:hypothetical protein
VTNSEPGGYAVIIPKDNLPGFLPTQAILRTGEEILAQFVCVHNNRILLSARFSNTSVSIKTGLQQTDWHAQLDDMDSSGEQEQPYEEEAPAAPGNDNRYDYGQAPPTFEAPGSQPNFSMPGSDYNQQPAYSQPAYSPSQTQSQSATGGFQAPPGGRTHDGGTIITPPPSMAQPTPSAPPQQVQQPQQQPQQGAPKQVISTHRQTPFPLAQTDEERAFNVWVESQPRKFHLKRATDLILPPLDLSSEQKFKISEYDLEWLITHLEGGMTTGCVKASSEERLSRSAMLLYRGRAVGCIYGCKSMPETQPTEQSLQRMLADLELPDTNVRMYDLPEGVTLAMSALFLGYPVQRNDDYDALSYMDYICNWFESKAQTACLAITLPSSQATCLGFIHKGQYVGAFYVEDQKFNKDIAFVHDLLRKDKDANVEASILPPEMTSSAVRFGFSLSMARQRIR